MVFIHSSRNTKATWAAVIMGKQNVVYIYDKNLIQVFFCFLKKALRGGGLYENSPHKLKNLNAWFPVWWNCLRSIKRCGLVGIDVLKPYTFPRFSLSSLLYDCHIKI